MWVLADRQQSSYTRPNGYTQPARTHGTPIAGRENYCKKWMTGGNDGHKRTESSVRRKKKAEGDTKVDVDTERKERHRPTDI